MSSCWTTGRQENQQLQPPKTNKPPPTLSGITLPKENWEVTVQGKSSSVSCDKLVFPAWIYSWSVYRSPRLHTHNAGSVCLVSPCSVRLNKPNSVCPVPQENSLPTYKYLQPPLDLFWASLWRWLSRSGCRILSDATRPSGIPQNPTLPGKEPCLDRSEHPLGFFHEVCGICSSLGTCHSGFALFEVPAFDWSSDFLIWNERLGRIYTGKCKLTWNAEF